MLAWNVAVILWGAYVRATGSGAGCGAHWPLCNGEVVPRAPDTATLIEFSHRVTSGLALVLVFVLAVWIWRTMAAGHPARRAAIASLVFIVIEALLGAGLVLFRLVANDESLARAMVMPLHLANTMVLLLCLTLTCHSRNPSMALTPATPAEALPGQGPNSTRRGPDGLTASGGLSRRSAPPAPPAESQKAASQEQECRRFGHRFGDGRHRDNLGINHEARLVVILARDLQSPLGPDSQRRRLGGQPRAVQRGSHRIAQEPEDLVDRGTESGSRHRDGEDVGVAAQQVLVAHRVVVDDFNKEPDGGTLTRMDVATAPKDTTFKIDSSIPEVEVLQVVLQRVFQDSGTKASMLAYHNVKLGDLQETT